jgi:hypothetical protein
MTAYARTEFIKMNLTEQNLLGLTVWWPSVLGLHEWRLMELNKLYWDWLYKDCMKINRTDHMCIGTDSLTTKCGGLNKLRLIKLNKMYLTGTVMTMRTRIEGIKNILIKQNKMYWDWPFDNQRQNVLDWMCEDWTYKRPDVWSCYQGLACARASPARRSGVWILCPLHAVSGNLPYHQIL